LERKNKISIIVIVIIVIVGILFALYHVLSRTAPIENYISKDTIAFAYKTNSGKSGKVFESLLSEISFGKSPANSKQMEMANKYINSAFIQLQGGSGGPFAVPSIIIGVHPKFYPIVQLFVLSHYATRVGNGMYILKPDMQAQIANGLGSNAYFQNLVRNGKIYIKPYKGYFLIGLSQNDLNGYIGQLDSKQYNGAMQSEVKKLRSKSSLFVIANVVETVSKTPLALFLAPNPNLNYIEMYTHYEKTDKNMSINWDFLGQNEVFNGYKMSDKSPSLIDYSGNVNSLYLSSSNMTQLMSMMKLFAGKWIVSQGDNPLMKQVNQVMSYQLSNGTSSVIGRELLIGVTSQGTSYVAFSTNQGGGGVYNALPQIFGSGRPIVQNYENMYFLNTTSTSIKIGEFYKKDAFLNGIIKYKAMTLMLLGTSNGNTLHITLSTNSQALAKSFKNR